MKKRIVLLLVLCMVLGLVACKKPVEAPDKTGTSQNTANAAHTGSTETKQANDIMTATGYTGVDLPGNDDLIDPNKFGGKKLQIYGYDSDVYNDLNNMMDYNSFIWMVRAAVDEWATLNNVEVEYVGGYDQSVILSDIHIKGGKPDLLLYCNQFPLPALSGITRAFT